MAIATFWAGTDGKDGTYGVDTATVLDGTASASVFFSLWTEFEGILSGLTDAPTTSFESDDKVYFLTGNEYVYYNGTTAGNVTDIAKVPTVTLGKKPDGTSGTANEKFNHLSDKWKTSYDPDGIATAFVLDKIYQSDGVTPITLSANLFKAYIYEVEKVEGTDFTFNRTTWTATFTSAPAAGTDTLQIQLEATALMDQTLIAKCTMAIEYAGNNNTAVFISGHPTYPNIVRYSWFYDPTYFPEDADISVGNDSRSVTGWGRMNDYLITYKEPGDEFVQWYSYINVDSTSGSVTVPTFGLSDEFGCIAPRTVLPAQNGLLALSDKGVVWTWASLTKGQANCKIVSQGVNGKNGIASGILDNTKADLALAHAEISGNKYLLHIKDKVWVLDLEYSDLAGGVYCWYPYTGIYANAGYFLTRSDVLYMGDNVNGLIYSEQQITNDNPYSDDGVAIDAWWTSPLMFLGGREWIKKFERINLTFKASYGTEHTLTLISDSGEEDIVLLQESGIFDARYFHASYFNAGTEAPNYPKSQGEKIGIKAEYFQFRIRNNTLNRSIAMLAVMISFKLRKKVK